MISLAEVTRVIFGPKDHPNLKINEEEICILVRDPSAEFLVRPIVMGDAEAQNFLSRVRAWIRQRSDPDDRVECWESVGENGAWDYNLERKIINSRLKPGEEEIEEEGW